MKRFIQVSPGEVMVGQGDILLKSRRSDSFMMIAAHDSLHKVGALAHAVFMAQTEADSLEVALKSKTAEMIDQMICDMSSLGANCHDIEFSFLTSEGASVDRVKAQNSDQASRAVNWCKEKNIRIKESSVIDRSISSVSLDVCSGHLACF